MLRISAKPYLLLALVCSILFFTVFMNGQVRADSWDLPEPRKYYSSNREYCLRIIPRRLTSRYDYFRDGKDGKKNPGSPEGLKDNYCRAILYKRGSDEKYHQEWSIQLVNDVAPVFALISNNGNYVVTFDNWHFVGEGDDVVVIYDQKGKLIKKLALEEFVPSDRASKILRTATSRWWWGGKHYLDEANNVLVLKISSKGQVRINLQELENEPQALEVHINLKTGALCR